EDHGTVIEHRAEPPAPPATPVVVSAKDTDAKPSTTGQSAAGEGPLSAESSQPAPPPASQKSEGKEKEGAAGEAGHARPLPAGGGGRRRGAWSGGGGGGGGGKGGRQGPMSRARRARGR